MRFTYSRWDGTQALEELDPEKLIETLAEDVLDTGELDPALAHLSWRGVDDESGSSGAKSLVEAFVRERERLRNERRPGREQRDGRSDSSPGEAPRTADGRETVAATRRQDGASGQSPDAGPVAPPLDAADRRNAAREEFGRGPHEGGGTAPDGESQAMSAARAVRHHHAGLALAEPEGTVQLGDLPGVPDVRTGKDSPATESGRTPEPGAGELEEVEHELLQAFHGGSLGGVDVERLERVLGRGARELLERLLAIPAALIRAGYLELDGDHYQLTARGLRRIGQKALSDIFRTIESLAPGDHPLMRIGVKGTDPVGHKRYDAESDFVLDLNRTLLNAVERVGPVRPVALTVADFEVVRTERTTQAATVLMLDVSPSMALRGYLAAGRRVALALHALIEDRFPRDRLHLVAFSGYARLIRAEAIHGFGGTTREYGTNLHHALVLARRLLARHRGTRQVIVITDGEPTAHLEGDRVHFAYPPTARTRIETLREVRRCTRDDIVINTFMLDRSEALTDFVDDVTRINRGRAFFTTPDQLGSYVLLDYVRGRTG